MDSKIVKFSQAIYTWLSTFGTVYRGVLPAGKIPDSPYLQISGYYETFGTQFILPVQIYKHNNTSYVDVLTVAEAIGNAVGYGGTLITGDGIKFKVDKGSPFYQDKPDEDPTVRAGYVNLIITIY